MDTDFEIPAKERKRYKTLQIEEKEAEKFREIAKKNGITQTMLLRWLINKVKECKEKEEGHDVG